MDYVNKKAERLNLLYKIYAELKQSEIEPKKLLNNNKTETMSFIAGYEFAIEIINGKYDHE